MWRYIRIFLSQVFMFGCLITLSYIFIGGIYISFIEAGLSELSATVIVSVVGSLILGGYSTYCMLKREKKRDAFLAMNKHQSIRPISKSRLH